MPQCDLFWTKMCLQAKNFIGLVMLNNLVADLCHQRHRLAGAIMEQVLVKKWLFLNIGALEKSNKYKTY